MLVVGIGLAVLVVVGTLLALSLRTAGRTVAPDARATQPTPDVTAGGSVGTGASLIGRATCAECHAEETQRWTGSHHDLAMQEAGEHTVLGDFEGSTLTHGGTTSRFFRRDGRFLVETDGPDGALHEYEITYTFGVTPLQQYLVPMPGGRLQALGIAWDARPAAHGGQRWMHLYPDDAVTHDDAVHWTRPSQNWNDRCAACHSTGLRKGYRADENRYDTTWAELDVSCEACHGPGSAHAAWARARVAPTKPDAATGRDDGLVIRFPGRADWVLDATRPTAHRARPLESRAEVAACAPCHSRRSELGPDDVPGVPYFDTYEPALLEEGLYFADGQMRDEVYEYGSFLQSRMYAEGVTCSDCHEPHALDLRAEGNALCTRCHRADVFDVAAHHFHTADSPGARCIACHMPARTYMLVDERRDHSFRLPRPDLTERLGVPNACEPCHAERSAAWAAAAIAKHTKGSRLGAPHYGDAIAAGRQWAVNALPLLAGLADDPTQPAIARATALWLLGGNPDPAAAAAIGRAAGDADPLLRLGAVRALDGADRATALALAGPRLDDPRRAVRFAAARVLAGAPASALAPERNRALRAALEEYERALRAEADRPEALTTLGYLYARLGRIADAEKVLQTSMRLAPYFIPAYVNLADIRRAQERDGEGESILRAALVQAPESAEVHHALALLLVRRGQTPAAIEELTRAAALAPEDPHHAYVLAVALHSSGESARAIEVLRAAHDRAPSHRDVLRALATISRDRGDLDAARTYAEALAALTPWDSQARAFAEHLRAPSPEPAE